MGRNNGQFITYDDALYMSNNEGFTTASVFSGSNKVMTRENIEACLCCDTSQFDTYTSNQMVPYQKLNPKTWYVLGMSSYETTTFGFHRFRLYNPNNCTYVAIFNDNQTVKYPGTPHEVYDTSTMVDSAIFNKSNGYEHAFEFDTTGLPYNFIIAISGIPDTATFQQFYANYVEYSGVYNSSNLISFYLGICNPTNFLRLDTCPLSSINYDGVTQINADNIHVDNTSLSASDLDKVLEYADANGKSNGFLDYTNTDTPTSSGKPYYDSLLAKGWTINGPQPVGSSTISTSQNTVTIPANGGSQNITVYSNTDWDSRADAGIVLTPEIGNGDTTVNIDIPFGNGSASQITKYVDFTTTDDVDTVRVTVIQEGNSGGGGGLQPVE